MRSSWGILRSERIVSGFGRFNVHISSGKSEIEFFPSVSQVDLSLTREGLHSIVLRKDRLEIAKFQPRAYPATRALRSMNLVDIVRSVLKQKGQNIWSVSPEAWVYDAIEMMAEKHVAALLVISEGKLLGIISERDYARKVILQGKSSRQTRVKEIMTSPVIFVLPEHTVEDCMRIMTNNRIRHLPVVENEKVSGVVSIGDLVKWIISAHEETINQLQHYITGSYPA
jgi:CBS domain-containing protein